jgi:hypothetical protein
MVRTRRSAREDANKLIMGIGALVLALMVVVAVGLLVWNVSRSKIRLDAQTQCPLDGPRSITTVVIDRTDPISKITERDLRNRLDELTRSVPRYGALYLYTIDGGHEGVGDPLFFRCNPGDQSTANALVDSTGKIQKNFEATFAKPLDAVMGDLLRVKTAPRSPIMEAVQAVAVDDFSSKAAPAADPRRLIVVSDFMQNSDRVSFYGGGKGDRLRAPEVLNAPLTGVEVSLLFIQRPDRGGPSAEDLRSVWRDYFIESGVASPRVMAIKLTGANP